MLQPVLHRIRFHVRGDFVHEAFLRERILQARGRAQRTGEERRRHGMRQHALASDGAGAVVLAADAARDIRGHRVAAVVEILRIGRARARLHRLRREAKQQARRDIARRVVAGTVAERRRPCLVVPRDDVPLRVETDLLIDDERQAVVLAPRHFVLARQLHANRLAGGLREHRRVVGGGVGSVQSVAARSARIDHTHLLRLQSQHHRRRAAQRVHRLRGRPDRRVRSPHVRNGARAAERAVHLVRMQIGRLDALRRALQLRLHVLRVHRVRVTASRMSAKVGVEIALPRQRRPRIPGDLQLLRRLQRLPRLVSNDANEVLLDDDLHVARHAGDRALVNAGDRGANRRRTHHAAVHHARHAHVVHVLEAARRQRRHVDTSDRSSEHRPALNRLALRILLDRDVEALAANQLAVADLLRGVRLVRDDAVDDVQIIGGRAELRRGHRDQRLARRRARLRQVLVIEVHRMALAAR